MQEVPEKSKDAAGAPWQLVGLLPLFDPPRHDSAETIRRALHLGVNVKMITGWSCFILILKFVLVPLLKTLFAVSSMSRGSARDCQGNWQEAWNGNKHVPLFFIARPR